MGIKIKDFAEQQSLTIEEATRVLTEMGFNIEPDSFIAVTDEMRKKFQKDFPQYSKEQYGVRLHELSKACNLSNKTMCELLKAAGCKNIRAHQFQAVSAEDREKLKACLNNVAKGLDSL